MGLFSFVKNIFHKSEDAIATLNGQVASLFPGVSALETALAANVKAAYPMLTAELYTAIKQAGNEAVQAVLATAPDAAKVLSGTETIAAAMVNFEANLGKLGLNPASLTATAKGLLLGASQICLQVFGPTIEGALTGNPTSPPASSSAAPSSAVSKQ